MLIRLGYDISFDIPVEVPIVALLNVYPSRTRDLLEPDVLKLDPAIPIETYTDSFGNQCSRFVAQPGTIRLYNSTLIQDPGELDPGDPSAAELPVKDLTVEVLRYLLPSRYCEVDLLTSLAADLFGDLPPGWNREKAVCRLVDYKVSIGYHFARQTKSA